MNLQNMLEQLRELKRTNPDQVSEKARDIAEKIVESTSIGTNRLNVSRNLIDELENALKEAEYCSIHSGDDFSIQYQSQNKEGRIELSQTGIMTTEIDNNTEYQLKTIHEKAYTVNDKNEVIVRSNSATAWRTSRTSRSSIDNSYLLAQFRELKDARWKPVISGDIQQQVYSDKGIEMKNIKTRYHGYLNNPVHAALSEEYPTADLNSTMNFFKNQFDMIDEFDMLYEPGSFVEATSIERQPEAVRLHYMKKPERDDEKQIDKTMFVLPIAGHSAGLATLHYYQQFYNIKRRALEGNDDEMNRIRQKFDEISNNPTAFADYIKEQIERSPEEQREALAEYYHVNIKNHTL